MVSQASTSPAAAARRPSSWSDRPEGRTSWKSAFEGKRRQTSWASKGSEATPPRKASWATTPRRTSWAAGKNATVAAVAAGSCEEAPQSDADFLDREVSQATPTASAPSSPSTPAAASSALSASGQRRNTWRAAAKAIPKLPLPAGSEIGEAELAEASPADDVPNDSGGGAAGSGALSLAAAWRKSKSRWSVGEVADLSLVAKFEGHSTGLCMVPEASCGDAAKPRSATWAGPETTSADGSAFSGSETFEDRPAEAASKSAGWRGAEAISGDESALSGSETFEDRPAEAQVDDMTTRLNQLIAAISQATGLELSITPGVENGAYEVAASPSRMAGGDSSGLKSFEDTDDLIGDAVDHGAGEIESGADAKSGGSKSARSPPRRLGRINSEKVLKMLNIITSNIAAAELEDTCEPSSLGPLAGSLLGDSLSSHDGERQRRASAPPAGSSEPSSSMRRVSARQPMQRQSQDVILRLREQEAENARLVEQLERLRADMEVLASEKTSLQLHSAELDRQHQEELSVLHATLAEKTREAEQLEKLRLECCQPERGTDSKTLRDSVQKLRQGNSLQRAPSENSSPVELARLQRENMILRNQLEAAVELRDRLAKSDRPGWCGSGDDNLHSCLAQLQQEKHELELGNSDLEARLQEQELKASIFDTLVGALRAADGDLSSNMPSGGPASPERGTVGFKTPESKHAVTLNDSQEAFLSGSQFSEDLLRVNVKDIRELQQLHDFAAALQHENEKLRGQVKEVAKLQEWLQRADPDTPGRDDESLLESKRNLDASFLKEATHDDSESHRNDARELHDAATDLSEQAVQNLATKHQDNLAEIQSRLDRANADLEEWKAKEAERSAELAEAQAALDASTLQGEAELLRRQQQLDAANAQIEELKIKEELARLHEAAHGELVEYRNLSDSLRAQNESLEAKHREGQQTEANMAERHGREMADLREEERARYARDLTRLLEEEQKRCSQELAEYRAEEQRHHFQELAAFRDEEHRCAELAKDCEEEQRRRAQELAALLEEERSQHARELAELCQEEQSCHAHQFAAFRQEEVAVSERHSREVEQLFVELQSLRCRTVEPSPQGTSMSAEVLERKSSTESIKSSREKWGQRRKSMLDGKTEANEEQLLEVHVRKNGELEGALEELRDAHRNSEMQEQSLREETCRLESEEQRLIGLWRGSEAHASLQDATVQALRDEESRLAAREEVYQSLASELKAERNSGSPSFKGRRRSQEVREEEFLDLTDEIKIIRKERQKVLKFSDEMHQSLQAKDSELARLRTDVANLESEKEALERNDEVRCLEEARQEDAAKLSSEVCDLKLEYEQSLRFAEQSLRFAQEARERSCSNLEGEMRQLQSAQESTLEENRERLCCEEAQILNLQTERIHALQELRDLSNRFQSEEQDFAHRHEVSCATFCSEKSALEAQHTEVRQELTDMSCRFDAQWNDLVETHQASLSAVCSKKSLLESEYAELHQAFRSQSEQFKSSEQESSEGYAANLHSVHGEKTELERQCAELKTVLERDRLRFAEHETSLAQRHSDALSAVCNEKAQLEAEHAELLQAEKSELEEEHAKLCHRSSDALITLQAEKSELEEEHAKFRHLHGQESAQMREVLQDARAEMSGMAARLESARKKEEEEQEVMELLARERRECEMAEAALRSSERHELSELREAHSKLLEENRQLAERLRVESPRPDLISPIRAVEPLSAIMSLPGDSHEGSAHDSESSAEADKIILADEEPWPTSARPNKLVLEVLERLGAMQKVIAAGKSLSCSHSASSFGSDSQRVAALHIHIYMRREECNNLSGTFTYVFV